MNNWKLGILSGLVAMCLLFSACAGGSPATQTTNAPVVIPPKPAEFKVTGLIAPSAPVQAGVKAPVTVSVSNTGEISGSYAVVLKIDGQEFATQQLTLAGGESKTVNFDVSCPKQGTYKLMAGEATTDFKVNPISMSDATLHQNDLPAGFTIVSSNDLQIDFQSYAASLGYNITPCDWFGFTNTSSTTSVSFIYGFKIYPLSTFQQINADVEIASYGAFPESIMDQLGAMGLSTGSFELLPPFDHVGDKSFGIRLHIPQGGINLVFDMIMFRNGNTMTYIYQMGIEGISTGVSLEELVNLLQARIDAVEASR